MNEVDLLKLAITNNDWEKALGIAKRYPGLAKKSITKEIKDAIILAHESYKHPSFYTQLGQDIEIIKENGIKTLIEYYS